MITPYLSQQPVDDFGLRLSGDKFSATLATSTDTTLTCPNSTGENKRWKAVIKASVDAMVYFSVNNVAEVPAGASFAVTTSESIPVNGVMCREVKAGDVLHFITAGTSVDVCVVFYALNNNSGI